MTRCVLADDHPALLAAVGDYLAENGYDVVARAADGSAALRHIERERPEVALIDYRMPGCFGGELVGRIREVSPDTRVAVYTAEVDASIVEETLGAGADAVLLKEAPMADLVRALRAVAEGRRYVDPALTGRAGGTEPAAPRLTERELAVLRLLAEGLSHEEIGARLSIAAETVRTHSRKAADRLGAKTRTQAVASAIRLGLV
jgi:two-component system nitrate/nitrite response regulator NarL